MKISRGHVPPGGWHYQVAPNVRLEAVNEDALREKIFAWRARNNIPIGDIERDLDDYYCSQWPEACVKEPKDFRAGLPGGPRREPMLSRVTQWASMLAMRMPRGGFPLVDQTEANRRSSLCSVCPMNTKWRGGCSGCSAVTSNLLMQLRSQRVSANNGSLMGCLVAGWDNMTAVHHEVANLGLTTQQVGELPANCWRKTA